MPRLQFLKMLNFPRALQKLQNRVNFSFFSYLKFFPVSIIKKTMFTVSVKQLNLIKELKKIKRWKLY